MALPFRPFPIHIEDAHAHIDHSSSLSGDSVYFDRLLDAFTAAMVLGSCQRRKMNILWELLADTCLLFENQDIGGMHA